LGKLENELNQEKELEKEAADKTNELMAKYSMMLQLEIKLNSLLKDRNTLFTIESISE